MGACWPIYCCMSRTVLSACPGTTPASWWRTAVRATQILMTTLHHKVFFFRSFSLLAVFKHGLPDKLSEITTKSPQRTQSSVLPEPLLDSIRKTGRKTRVTTSSKSLSEGHSRAPSRTTWRSSSACKSSLMQARAIVPLSSY